MTDQVSNPGSEPRWQTLLSVEELATALGRPDVVVLDARSSLADPAACERAYRQSHVPGAYFAALDRDLSDHSRPGGRHPWPSAEDFTARLGEWGITPDHQVVVYDAGDGGLSAARAWFLLRALGHRDVAVLDGGWKSWTAQGCLVEVGTPVSSTPVAYHADFDRALLFDAPQVQAHLAAGGMLLDARASERYRGDVEPIDKVAGHVPGAINRPYAENLDDGRFKPATTLRQEFTDLLEGRDPHDVVVMCGSGVTACHHLLAMEHAGLPGAKLFTGSWSGWIEDPSRPVATGA
ncbi:sulfurtransferase [Lysobacter sp. A03]|uniref:sulfurtransferase n=1 Tax=Lysobacter sp. A03 TaxID=1199154 RepID=UPI0005B6D5B4|nr:sulfurtransferase [Lysobacter sp. A03]KIQ98126.1 Thiosulfate sulfurtransferase, rhodanese [Lysobacter sp. A03]